MTVPRILVDIGIQPILCIVFRYQDNFERGYRDKTYYYKKFFHPLKVPNIMNGFGAKLYFCTVWWYFIKNVLFFFQLNI